MFDRWLTRLHSDSGTQNGIEGAADLNALSVGNEIGRNADGDERPVRADVRQSVGLLEGATRERQDQPKRHLTMAKGFCRS